MNCASYEVQLEPRAIRQLSHIDPVVRRRLAKAIDGLAAEPRPPGTKALAGMPGVLRVRVGDYRILYEVSDDRRLVVVINVDHRRDVYR